MLLYPKAGFHTKVYVIIGSIMAELVGNSPVDPREFLARPFQNIQLGDIVVPPDRELLQYLPNLRDESGVVYINGRWYVIKASEIGIPAWAMPQGADILMHSHTALPDDPDGTLPSPQDFWNCSPTARNFVIGQGGLTRYYRPEDGGVRRRLEIAGMYGWFRPGMIGEYMQFLQQLNLKYVTYSWKSLTERGLQDLFYS